MYGLPTKRPAALYASDRFNFIVVAMGGNSTGALLTLVAYKCHLGSMVALASICASSKLITFTSKAHFTGSTI